MTTLYSEKLSTNYIGSTNSFYPLLGRKYTLTHSDQTGQLFLDIGTRYNLSSINLKMRDEVLAEWKINNDGILILFGTVYVDHGEYSKEEAFYRYKIFHKEMPLALKAIINGDISFYSYYPFLLNAPIVIYFQSIFPEYNGISNYGTPREYLV